MAQKLVIISINAVFINTGTLFRRNLADIKKEISERLFSNEYLPQFIVRSADLKSFCDTVGEFFSFYVKQLEDWEFIWSDKDLLKKYLKTKHMYFNENETLSEIQTIAGNRLKTIAARGTKKMDVEIKRICNESVYTGVVFKDFGECGFVVGKTSPCYRTSATAANVSYIGVRELVVFDLKNQNNFFDKDTLKEIIRKYFVPQHIVTLYNFI